MEDRTGPQDGQRADDGSQRRHRRSRGRGRPPGSPGEAGAPQQEPRAPQQGPQREPRRERPQRGEETERTERAPRAREERTGGRPAERRRDRPPREQAPVIEQRPPRDQKDAREAAKAAVEQPPSRRPVKRRRSVVRTIAFIGLALLLVVVLWRTMQGTRGYETIPYSKLVTEHIASGQIERITVTGDRLLARLRGSERDRLVYLGDMEITPAIADAWTARGIAVEFRPTGSAWRVFLTTLPYLAIIVVILFLFRQAQGGSRGIFAFGKSRARELTGQDVPRVTFTDVAGIEEAKQELQEIVEFLRDPERFQRLGGKIPRGVIMIGPPGTGKTYLARAIAGEAQVPFFYISGSDFVEMFVGVGASRVRDLFEQAKAKAPCIIFIDEIDAVGRHRGAGLGGGHDEREQTLNQLLVEMDGFSSTTTVILVAATNRPDVLDPALLRPGRFDRQVFLDMPDLRGREGILKIHTRRVPLAADVDLHAVAKGTPGLSGADLRNLVNEAALLAARRGRQDVGMTEFERAKEKVMWGMERRSLVMSDQERRLTSVHEAGHALVALFTPEADPPHKVSIVPRGRALGLTAFLPDDERHTVTRSWCEAKLMSILGGRAAEEIVFGEISNGGANDLETATELSRRMICDWGMSDRLGPVMIGKRDEEIFIGKDLVQTRAVSDRTLQTIDEELRRIIDGALRNARTLLEDRRDLLEAVAEALLVHEALDRAAIDEIVRARAGRVAAVPIIVEEGEPSRPRVVERRASGIAAVSERPADVRPEPQPEQAPEEPRPERERRPRRQERAPEPAVEAVDTRPEIVEAREDVSEPFVVPAVVRAPVPIYTPPKPTEFGRRPKVVRRFGLPSSKVPESGQEVSTFIRAEITYGRALRPVEAMFIPEESAEPSAGAPENSTAEAPSVAEIAAAPEIEIVAERPAEEPIAKDTMPAGEVTEAALSIVEPEPMPDSAPVVADVEPVPPPAAANVEPPPPESEPGAVEAEAPVRPPRRRRRRTKAAAEEPSETAEGAAVEADVVIAPEFGREPRPAADETKERTEELVEAASTGERPPAAEDTPAEENAKRPAEEAPREVAEAPSDKGTEKPAGEEGERPAGA